MFILLKFMQKWPGNHKYEISVRNSSTCADFFSYISLTMQPTNIPHTPLERSVDRVSALICCMKIHAEMAEIS